MNKLDKNGGPISKETLNAEFENIKLLLHAQCTGYQKALENEEKVMEELKEEELVERKNDARVVLESSMNPLIYIASLVSWMTAGERNNIMLTFIAYCSQVILDNPISVIALGEGSSGKALALDTKIPTPDGFKTINEIDVGDDVFDE